MKSLAGTMSGLMGVFHGIRGVLSGDATAMVNVATGASMLWRAASNLHPVLRVVAIAGTAITAAWPLISQYFESAATKAAKMKQAFLDAGLALTGLGRAQEKAARLESSLARQEKLADAARKAYSDLAAALDDVAASQRDLDKAKVDVQLARDLNAAGDDEEAQAVARDKAARANAEIDYNAVAGQAQKRIDDAQMAKTAAEQASSSADSMANSKTNVRKAAEGELDKALYTGAKASSPADRALMIEQARAGNREGFNQLASQGGMWSKNQDPKELKAVADAYDALRKAVEEEKNAQSEAQAAAINLTSATDALGVAQLKSAKEIEVADANRKNAIEKSGIELGQAEGKKYKDLEAARKEDAAFEEEQRFGKLTPAKQRKELDAKIAEQQKSTDAMSDSDPAKAQAIRELTTLKQRRAGIGEDAPKAPGEGFDSFLAERAKMPSGPRMADTDGARRFRSKLGPSFADKLTGSAFGKGGKEGDKRTAEETLLALQEKSVEYQKIMAEKIVGVALKE